MNWAPEDNWQLKLTAAKHYSNSGIFEYIMVLSIKAYVAVNQNGKIFYVTSFQQSKDCDR